MRKLTRNLVREISKEIVKARTKLDEKAKDVSTITSYWKYRYISEELQEPIADIFRNLSKEEFIYIISDHYWNWTPLYKNNISAFTGYCDIRYSNGKLEEVFLDEEELVEKRAYVDAIYQYIRQATNLPQVQEVLAEHAEGFVSIKSIHYLEKSLQEKMADRLFENSKDPRMDNQMRRYISREKKIELLEDPDRSINFKLQLIKELDLFSIKDILLKQKELKLKITLYSKLGIEHYDYKAVLNEIMEMEKPDWQYRNIALKILRSIPLEEALFFMHAVDGAEKVIQEKIKTQGLLNW